MGTVHKFKRPPKNQQQFKGYRPEVTEAGKSSRRRLSDWQKSVLAWSLLVLLAVGIWVIGALIEKS
jgi:hypothetical protein